MRGQSTFGRTATADVKPGCSGSPPDEVVATGATTRRVPAPGAVLKARLRAPVPAFGDSLDLGATLQAVAGAAVEVLDARVCLVLFVRDDMRALHVRAACAPGFPPVEAAMSLAPYSLAARVIESGALVRVDDGVEPPRLAPRALGERLGIRSGIAAPLHDGSRLVGAILAYHSEPRRFREDEAWALTALASQAAPAIRNCALYEQQREIADTFQRSFAPRIPKEIGGVQVGHRYLPRAGRVGGDYYDLLALPDGRLSILMGDVSGSGLHAAIHTAMGKYMARAFTLDAHPPGTVLRKLNDAMCAYGTGEVFLTAFAGVLHPNGRLHYANGAHPYPIIRRARGALSLLETTGTVVGIIREQRYQEREMRLRRGDILVLYTDGIIEAPCRRELFGLERLQAAVRQWDGDHPQDLADHVVGTVRAFTGGHLRDDVAVLALRAR